MGERNTGLFLMMELIFLISFIGIFLITLNLGGLFLISELALLFVLVFFSLISAILIYYKVRFGSVLSMLILAVILGDLLFIYSKSIAVDRSMFFITLLFSLIGFIISVGSIKREEEIEEEQTPVVETYTPGKYVASKTGSVYHAPKCDWAKKIKENKQVWFDSEKEAKKKYKPHSCIKK